MKSNMETSATRPTPSMRLFMDAVTYRVPFPITKVMACANTTYPICPRCAVSLDREYISFCDRCGQKLNWDLFEYAKVTYPNHKKD